MPRGRGGKREGVVGKAYANRTDLGGANVVSAQPVNQAQIANQTIPGQAYGAAAAQKESMSAVPMANTQTPSMQQPPAGSPTQSAPAKVVPLDAPGDPNQSLFHGMDSIPGGAGSEAMLATLPPSYSAQALTLLNTLGEDVSPQIQYIRTFLSHQSQNGAPK